MIPKYVLLKDQLAEAISSKKYPLFSKLPTEIELSQEYNVSRTTVRLALALLEEDGIIEKRWGSGNIVVNTYDSSKKEAVALVIPSMSEKYYSDIVTDLQTIFYKEQLQLQIFETHNSQVLEREILSVLLNDIYAGYIIAPAASPLPSINIDLFQKIQKRHLPLLFIDSVPLQSGTVSSVKVDDYESGYLATRYLINKGHSSIGSAFCYNTVHSFDRYSGYMNACRDSKTPIDENSILWYDLQNSLSDSMLVDLCQRVTAIVCDSEPVTEKILDFCVSHNISIPDNLAVICCSDCFSHPGLPLSISALSPIKSMGKEIALNFLLHKKDGSVKNTTIKNKLIPREST